MSHYHYRYDHRSYPPNKPQSTRNRPIEKLQNQQNEQGRDLATELEQGSYSYPQSSVKDPVSKILALAILFVIALTAYETGNAMLAGIDALVMALLIGGLQAVEKLLHLWKERAS